MAIFTTDDACCGNNKAVFLLGVFVRFYLATLLGTLWIHPGVALADPAPVSDRQEFQHAYATQLKSSPSLFDTAPIYHISPSENTITYAGSYNYEDVTIAPPGTDISADRTRLEERLDLTGWSASPYVAFSTKHFAFGFTGEIGKKEAYYLRLPNAGGATPGTSLPTYEEELGVATYSGIGLNVYWTPTWSFLPNYSVLTLIAGGKSLNVAEQNSGTLTEQYSSVKMTKYTYAVQNYEAGANIALRLVKRFTVIPWIDYSTDSVTAPVLSAGGNAASSNVAIDQSVLDDATLFWKTAPTLNYGIDFAVKIEGLDIHLGGLIGILGTLNKGSVRIQDNSRSVSISFDQRGNQ